MSKPETNGVRIHLLLSAAALALAACSQKDEPAAATPAKEGAMPAISVPAPDMTEPAPSAAAPERQAYFGDLHVHTKYSFDAYIFNVRATPDDAYNFAKGNALTHPAGFEMALSGPPLDFLAVTDHGEYLGVLPAMNTEGTALSKVPYAPDLFSTDRDQIGAAFQKIGISIRDGEKRPELTDPATERAAWQEIINAAERHNDPGTFTTFIAYEFTSAFEGKNLHRNVIFRDSAVPEVPFSAFDSQNPEGLWNWLDQQRAEGREGLAIPHNSNGSDGDMFAQTQWDGSAIDAAYSALRMRNEPLIEITQVKGTSETHPLLSPNDEWAGFEIMDSYIGTPQPITVRKGGYARDALNSGLEFETKGGFNPYKFGFIGASDTHTGAGAFDEKNYWAKVGMLDATPVLRGSVPPEGKDWDTYEVPESSARLTSFGASGLTGVWAEENTRDAIYAAFRRKETFATSGPRMKVRFFAGSSFDDAILTTPDLTETAYATGVPMGANLDLPADDVPEFIVWATQDPLSQELDRVQIIKGWVEDGTVQEQVFDVACAGGETPDPATHRCMETGTTIDLATCSTQQPVGAAELKTVWRDPDYEAGQKSYYYVRVLENKSCRWSNWDAIREAAPHNPALPKIIQERAWSSPIWVN